GAGADDLVEQHPQAVRRPAGGGAEPGHGARLLLPHEGAGRLRGGRGARAGSLAELEMRLASKRAAYHAPLYFWHEPPGEWVYTTAGRVIFNSILPGVLRAEGFRNQVMRKKDLSELVFESYRRAGLASTVQFLDLLKEFGFR